MPSKLIGVVLLIIAVILLINPVLLGYALNGIGAVIVFGLLMLGLVFTIG